MGNKKNKRKRARLRDLENLRAIGRKNAALRWSKRNEENDEAMLLDTSKTSNEKKRKEEYRAQLKLQGQGQIQIEVLQRRRLQAAADKDNIPVNTLKRELNKQNGSLPSEGQPMETDGLTLSQLASDALGSSQPQPGPSGNNDGVGGVDMATDQTQMPVEFTISLPGPTGPVTLTVPAPGATTTDGAAVTSEPGTSAVAVEGQSPAPIGPQLLRQCLTAMRPKQGRPRKKDPPQPLRRTARDTSKRHAKPEEPPTKKKKPSSKPLRDIQETQEKPTPSSKQLGLIQKRYKTSEKPLPSRKPISGIQKQQDKPSSIYQMLLLKPETHTVLNELKNVVTTFYCLDAETVEKYLLQTIFEQFSYAFEEVCYKTRTIIDSNLCKFVTDKYQQIQQGQAVKNEERSAFFTDLNALLAKYNYLPTDIYNVDEIRISVNQNTNLANYQQSLSEDNQLVDVINAANAEGFYVPPFFVATTERVRAFVDHLVDGMAACASETGRLTDAEFLQWLNHFAGYAQPTAHKPVLLILDNSTYHVNYQIYKFCESIFIHLLVLPHHVGKKMHPLELSLNGTLLRACQSKTDDLLFEEPGTIINASRMVQLYIESFREFSNKFDCAKGFVNAGLYPPDSDTFRDTFNVDNEIGDAARNIEDHDCVIMFDRKDFGKSKENIFSYRMWRERIDESKSLTKHGAEVFCKLPLGKAGTKLPHNYLEQTNNPRPIIIPDNQKLNNYQRPINDPEPIIVPEMPTVIVPPLVPLKNKSIRIVTKKCDATIKNVTKPRTTEAQINDNLRFLLTKGTQTDNVKPNLQVHVLPSISISASQARVVCRLCSGDPNPSEDPLAQDDDMGIHIVKTEPIVEDVFLGI